jgi:hypothetical protein
MGALPGWTSLKEKRGIIMILSSVPNLRIAYANNHSKTTVIVGLKRGDSPFSLML